MNWVKLHTQIYTPEVAILHAGMIKVTNRHMKKMARYLTELTKPYKTGHTIKFDFCWNMHQHERLTNVIVLRKIHNYCSFHITFSSSIFKQQIYKDSVH